MRNTFQYASDCVVPDIVAKVTNIVDVDAIHAWTQRRDTSHVKQLFSILKLFFYIILILKK
jgi:hypothetical protein